jgi:hypothetical protein
LSAGTALWVKIVASWLDPGRQVVEYHFPHGTRDIADAIAVGDHLIVGDHQEDLDAGALQAHAVGQRAEVVAEVQRPGGTIPSQYAEALRVLAHPVLERRRDCCFDGHRKLSLVESRLRLADRASECCFAPSRPEGGSRQIRSRPP